MQAESSGPNKGESTQVRSPKKKMPEKKNKKWNRLCHRYHYYQGNWSSAWFPVGEREKEKQRERVRETGQGASFFGSAAVDSFFFFF